MDERTSQVNGQASGTIAPLHNVGLLHEAIRHSVERPPHLPGLVVMHGPSGYGKSCAAAYAANTHRAYYVEARSVWPRKGLLEAVLREMGIRPAGRLDEMTDQAAEQLALSRRPLIIDEADHILARNLIEVVRDMSDGSQGTVVLIGEEGLPAKLKRHERVHNRVLRWVAAEPASLDDAMHLAQLYAPEIRVADDLLRRLVGATKGTTRRIVVNIESIRQEALKEGVPEATDAWWGARPLDTGATPEFRDLR